MTLCLGVLMQFWHQFWCTKVFVTDWNLLRLSATVLPSTLFPTLGPPHQLRTASHYQYTSTLEFQWGFFRKAYFFEPFAEIRLLLGSKNRAFKDFSQSVYVYAANFSFILALSLTRRVQHTHGQSAAAAGRDWEPVLRLHSLCCCVHTLNSGDVSQNELRYTPKGRCFQTRAIWWGVHTGTSTGLPDKWRYQANTNDPQILLKQNFGDLLEKNWIDSSPPKTPVS